MTSDRHQPIPLDIDDEVAPIRVGLVGIGFMGWIHYLAYKRSQRAELLGIATRDPVKRSGDWRSIKGNFGPPGEVVDLSNYRIEESLEALLNEPLIDVIDICLPPHLHADAIRKSIDAGKDVFCEKPFALTSRVCRELIEYAEHRNKKIFVGHVLPFMGPFSYATRAVQSGVYGKLIGGIFKRVINEPTWIPDFYDPHTVGGPIIDLHVHDTHWIAMLFGKPTSIHAVGRIQGEVAKYGQALYQFADPSVVVASISGVIDAAGRPFTHAFELHFERATIQFEFVAYDHSSAGIPLRVIPTVGASFCPELPMEDEIDAFRAEIDEMAHRVSQSNSPDKLSASALDSRYASDAIAIAEAIQRSILERKPIDL